MVKNHQKDKKLSSLAKFLILLFGGFVVMTIIIVGLVVGYRYLNQDNLINYLPADPILYIRFNEGVFSKDNSKLKELKPEQVFQILDKQLNINFEKEVLPMVKRQIAIALVELSSNKVGSVLLVNTEGQESVNKRVSGQVPFYLDYDSVVIFADSQETIDLIKAIDKTRMNPLSNKIYNRFFDDDFVKLHLDLNKLAKYFDREKTVQLLLSNFLDQSQAEELNFTLNKKLSHWFFKADFDGEVDANLYSSNMVNLESISFLPENFIFYSKGLDSQNLFADLASINQDVVENYQEDLKNIENSTYLNLIEEVWPMFSSGIDVIVLSSGDENSRSLDFVVNFSLGDNVNFDLSKLAEVFEEVIAKRYPAEVKRELPDKTYVIEFVAEPENFKFKSQKVGFDTIYYLDKDEPKIKIAYAIKNNEMILSSSINALQNLLDPTTESKVDVNRLKDQCWLKGKRRFVVINTKEINALDQDIVSFFNILPNSTYIISQDKDLTFSGCSF